MSQMLNWILVLPMVVGAIPRNDTKWEVFLSFRHFVIFLMQHSFSTGEIHELQADIRSFLAAFKQEFPTQSLTIKFHLLTHYPRIIEQSGPVCFLSSMRLEGKHKQLKQFCNITSNTINLSHTIVKRHQIRFAVRCLSQRGLKNFLITYTCKPKLVTMESLARFCDNLDLVVGLTMNSIVEKVKNIDVNGCFYQTGHCVFFGYTTDHCRFIAKLSKL